MLAHSIRCSSFLDVRVFKFDFRRDPISASFPTSVTSSSALSSSDYSSVPIRTLYVGHPSPLLSSFPTLPQHIYHYALLPNTFFFSSHYMFPCFFVSALFDNLSCFIVTMCPAHIIRLFTILPTIQASISSNLLSYISLFSFYPPLALALNQLEIYCLQTIRMYCISTARECRTSLFKIMVIFLTTIPPSAYLRAIVYSGRTTSAFPFSGVLPSKVRQLLTCICPCHTDV